MVIFFVTLYFRNFGEIRHRLFLDPPGPVMLKFDTRGSRSLPKFIIRKSEHLKKSTARIDKKKAVFLNSLIIKDDAKFFSKDAKARHMFSRNPIIGNYDS